MKNATSPIAISASGMPTPMPIFAPLDISCEAVVEELVGGGEKLVDVDAEVVSVDVIVPELLDDDVVVDEVLGGAESAAKSELWCQTGMPSPKT
jgi:hypothetical protein